MITAILNLIFNFLSWIISLFPVGTGFPSEFHTAFTSLGGYVHMLDPLLPIETLLACLTFVFSVEIALFGFKTFKWVISHVPLFGGKG